MMDWVPTWAWLVLSLTIGGSLWYFVGIKAAGAGVVAALAALFVARQRKAGYDAARHDNEREAWDAIDKANDARIDAHRRDADPERLRDTDGFRRD